jgi:hypothetical protein
MPRASRPPPDKPPPPRKSAAEMLDELLPLAEPAAAEMHTNAAVLEVDDPSRLLELAADSAVRALLLCRLAPTVALVDAGAAGPLLDILRRRGHTPKVVKP